MFLLQLASSLFVHSNYPLTDTVPVTSLCVTCALRDV